MQYCKISYITFIFKQRQLIYCLLCIFAGVFFILSFFVSNFQKIGYVKDGIDIILKPIKEHSFHPQEVSSQEQSELLNEAVAFYQTAADWKQNLKD